MLTLLMIGLTYALRRYRDDRFLFLGLYFLLWIFLLSLPGGKFTRYVITLLPAVVLLQSVGIYVVYSAVRLFLEKRGSRLSPVVLALLLIATAGWELNLNRMFHPMQSLYVSRQAGGESRWGYYFPQDDFYDSGLRETIQFVCSKAPPESTIVGTTPVTFKYYQAKFGRSDLRFVEFPAAESEFQTESSYFFIAQDYRQYLENNYILTFLRSELNPLFISRTKGHISVELYYLSRRPPYARSRFWTSERWPGLLGAITQRASDKTI